MGLVYDQFAQELESLQRKYADRPRDELIALCLMALEREELVTVGYHEDLMNRRTLASLEFPVKIARSNTPRVRTASSDSRCVFYLDTCRRATARPSADKGAADSLERWKSDRSRDGSRGAAAGGCGDFRLRHRNLSTASGARRFAKQKKM